MFITWKGRYCGSRLFSCFLFLLGMKADFCTCLKIYDAAIRGLSPVNSPLQVKFPLPDPRDPFSLKPGSISALTPKSKATEVDKSSSIRLAIAGAQAAATQFSKKDQNSHSTTARNNEPATMDNEVTDIARSYKLRSGSRVMENGNISSSELDMKFDDATLPSYREKKRTSNYSEGSSRQHRSTGAEADLKQYPPQAPSKVSLSLEMESLYKFYNFLF